MKKVTFLLSAVVLFGLVTGCGKTNEEVTSTDSQAKTSETSQAVASSDTKDESVSLKDTISVDEAIDLYNKRYPDTDITDLKLELSFGKYFYHIDGVDDNKEYELTINAVTKELSDEKEENLDKDEQNGVQREAEKLDLTKVISIEEASEIAVKKAGFGEATEWSLDRELNTTYWEVTVKEGHVKEEEIKIDAQDGSILSVEKD